MKQFRRTCVGLALLVLSSHVFAGVIINEIFYRAPSDMPPVQYLELWNFDSQPVSLAGWKLKQGVQFAFPSNTTIQPFGFLVISSDPVLYKKLYALESLGPFKRNLSISSSERGEVRLEDNQGKRVDHIAYSTGGSWPSAPNGFSASLERICPISPAEMADNWASSKWGYEGHPGGSPGRTNDSYRPQLPPRLLTAEINPQISKPGNPVSIIAKAPDQAVIKQIVAIYHQIKPGKELPEQSVVLTNQGNVYSALIPAAIEGLYRLKLKVVSNDGLESWFPAPNEPRPELSFAVIEPPKTGKIPLAYLSTIGSNDLRRLSNVSRNNGWSEEDQERWQLINAVQTSVPLLSLWTDYILTNSWTMLELEKARALFRSQFAQQKKWIQDIAETDDFSEVKNRLKTEVEKSKEGFLKSAEKALPAPVFKPLQSSLSKPRGGRNFEEAIQSVLRNFVNVDFPLFAATANLDISEAQLDRYRGLLGVIAAKRIELSDPVKQAMQGKGDWAAIRKDTMTFSEEFRTKIEEGLSPAQKDQLGKELEQPLFSGIRPRQQKSAPMDLRGNSTLLYIQTNGQAELYDYVQIVPRSAGYKVHFTKLQPFHGMTTINVIFEAQDRYVIAEPLAFDLYQRAHVPGCLTDFARVTLNEKPLGYHLIIEQPNHAFLHRNKFKDKGNMYKATWMGTGLVETHEKKTNLSTGHDDLIELVGALEKTKQSPAEQWKLIQSRFDVEEIARYYAVNMCLSHWDGFFNNYFFYHDVGGTEKWSMFAWDQDKTWGEYDGKAKEEVFASLPLTFGMEGDLPPGWPIGRKPLPRIGAPGAEWWRPGGFISKPLLANPYFRKVFLRELKSILEQDYTETVFFPIIENYRDRLNQEVKIRAEALGQNPEEAQKLFEFNLESLRRHLTARRAFLLDQPEIKGL